MAQSTEATVDLEALGELNSAEARALFDMIDKLSALGVGKIVDLPQIIVVGDQSAGKSSVLSALSQVHFPVHGGVCTRFATELVLSPSPRRRVQASVHFANSFKAAHTLHVDDFDQQDIKQIIDIAKKQMGLSETSRDYSRDVLRLEIEGPGMYHLTLVDLPGIYYNETDVQSPEGIQVVMDIMTSYMKKPNSIILAIISANSQVASQGVMKEAAKYDPARERTLGVITKPDLPPAGSDLQKESLQLVRNALNTHKLKLGWHVVRNRADYEDARPQDAIEEDFFSIGAWSSISPLDRGVTALRKRLSKLLYEHIKKSLPKVFKDIQLQLSERGDELSRLGEPRSTPDAMRLYLTGAAERFRDLVVDGTRGQYTDQFFGGFNDHDRKLRAQLRNWNRAIRHILLVHGSAYNVQELLFFNTPSDRRKPPPYLEEFLRGGAYVDLPVPKVTTRSLLAIQLDRQASINQGIELPGYSNMGLASQLFQEQTKQWEPLAMQHLEKVTSTVRDFVEQVVLEVTGPANERTKTAILSTHVEPFFDAKQEILSAKLQEILRPFKESYALALDADFQEAMHDMAVKRKAEGERNKAQQHEGGPSSLSGVKQDDGEFGTERIVDTVQTFYEMSLRTFTDNLINLAIESCLVQELSTIFSPSLVAGMSIDELSAFASEEEGVTYLRSQLQTDITLLKDGLELCRRNMPRNVKGRILNSTQAAQNIRATDSNNPITLPSSGAPANKGPSKKPSTTTNVFGAPIIQASGPSGRLFGSAPTFGTSNPSFSTAPASNGASSTGGAFSFATRPTPSSGGLFGNANTGSGSSTSASGGLFGQTPVPSTNSGANGKASGNATSIFAGASSAAQSTQSSKPGLSGSLGTPAK